MGPGPVDRHGVRTAHVPPVRGRGMLLRTLRWLGVLLVPATAYPQQGTLPARDAPVTSIEAAITVDGILDEPAWTAAPAIGDLVQRLPLPGLAPTERTRITLLRYKDNLYVGVVA